MAIQALAAVWGSKGHQPSLHQDRLCDINDALGPDNLFLFQRCVVWGRMCVECSRGLGGGGKLLYSEGLGEGTSLTSGFTLMIPGSHIHLQASFCAVGPHSDSVEDLE